MLPPLNAPPVLELAARLGLTVGRGGFGPCPSCGAERRGTGDTRPPLWVPRGGTGWRCYAVGCEARGDALALLAYVRHGGPLPKGDPRWRGLYAELRGESDGGPVPRMIKPAPPVVTPAPAPPDAGPDRREVAALWAACSPLDKVADTDPAIRWIRFHRSLPVEGIAALDLARVLPATGRLPEWVPWLGIDRSTWRTVYRLAVPVYDARGELASLRFRAIDRHPGDKPPPGCRFETRNGRRTVRAPLWTPDGEEPRGDRELPKALAARGVGAAAGLVMADPMGLALLRGELEDDGARWDGRVFVAEGETDLWRVAAPRKPRVKDGATYAVFGVEAGSWTAEHARHIPDGATVVLETDPDGPGDEYATAIGRTLAGRCKLKRKKRSLHADKD